MPEEVFYAKGAVIQSHYSITNESPDLWAYCVKVIVSEQDNNFDEVLEYRDKQLRREISRGINSREAVNVVQTRFERVGLKSFEIDFYHSNKTPDLVFVSPICEPEKSDLSFEAVVDIAYIFECNRNEHSGRVSFTQSSTLLGINLIKKGRLERTESAREKIIEKFNLYNRARGVGVDELAVQMSDLHNRSEGLS